MKKRLKWIGIILLAVLLIGLGFFLSRTLPILNGYNAKVMCSCVFVAGREQQQIEQQEFGIFPFNWPANEIDIKDSSVRSTILGLFGKKAIYREGIGCTLLNGISEPELKMQDRFRSKLRVIPDSSNRLIDGSDSVLANINQTLLQSALSDAFGEPLKDSLRRTRAVIVLYDGKIIAERYANGFNQNSILPGWSMTKTLINTWLGILLKQNKIDLNAKHLFPEWENDDRKNISLSNLLHDNSGLHWDENYRSVSPATQMLFQNGNMGAFALGLPLEFRPGEHFEYSSGTSNIISAYLRKQMGDIEYYQFPYKEIFEKIGMNGAILERDAGGNYVGSSYCFATARDWARLGLLYLNDGTWNGERILPEGWVKYSTEAESNAPIRPGGRYGAHFWLNSPDNTGRKAMPDVPSDCYRANGYEGQNVFIVPSKKLVIVRLAMEHDSKARLDVNKFVSTIIAAFSKGQ